MHSILNRKTLKTPRVFAGLSVSLIYILRLLTVPFDYFWSRDDGIITLSHAKNFLTSGFIGVSPSGDIVEGFSSPLQAALFIPWYVAFKDSIDTFNIFIFLTCSFAIGYYLYLLYEWLMESRRPSSPSIATGWILISVVFTAIFSTISTPYIMWMGSGMENPLTTAFTVIALVEMIISCPQKISFRRQIQLGVVFFLASVTRLDGIYFWLPLTLTWTIVYFWLNSKRRPRPYALAIFLLASALFMFSRYIYFGELTSNTSIVQGIDIGRNLSGVLAGQLNPGIGQSIKLTSVFNYASSAVGFSLVLLTKSANRKYLVLCLFAFSYLLLCFFYPLVVAPFSRLYEFRATVQCYIVVSIVVVSSFLVFASSRHGKSNFKPLYIALALPVLVIAKASYDSYEKPYDLCCSTKYFRQFAQEFDEAAQANKLAFPIISNPDLGIMSYFKKFNIVDLGYLGSKILSRLQNDHKARDLYLSSYAKPDLIESHDYWSCAYRSFLKSPEFAKAYRPIRESLDSSQCLDGQTSYGIWIRKDIEVGSKSPERRFIDALQGNLSGNERLSVIAGSEMDRCVKTTTFPRHDCNYVYRSIYRIMPLLSARRLSDLPVIVSASSEYGMHDIALHLLSGRSNPRAFVEFLDSIRRESASAH